MDCPITHNSIRSALESGALEYWYQPKVSFFSGHVCGGEALIRWRLPTGEILPAGAWLPVAESHGMMHEIAATMLPVLYQNIAEIQGLAEGVKMSFNMAASDIESEAILGTLLQAIESGLLDPHRVEVELLESALANDQDLLIKNMVRITDAGMTLAMDDFGTGFASLDLLRRLPFSTVKIDQGVVMSLQKSEKSSAIVFSSIRMAYEMGLNVVAEGVESEEIFDFLQHAGCNEAQGYWISQALPLEEFVSFAGVGKRWQATPIGQIRHVEIDHLLWCKNVLATVFGESGTDSGSSSSVEYSDHSQCRMGKWLSSQAGSLAEMEEFANLAAPHATVHQSGSRLLQAARNGASPEQLKVMASLFNKHSEALLHSMQELEVQILIYGLYHEADICLPNTGKKR